MESSDRMKRIYQILSHVSHVPRKMVALHQHHQENVPEFVLYELCHKDCFNLAKAAYFVDNPDFDCLKGVAGICKGEPALNGQQDVWQDPDQFTSSMQQSPFNKQVRDILHESARCKHKSDQELVEELAEQLALHNPHYISWDLKHGNHGLLVIEKEDEQDPWDEQYLHDSAHLLSFCPIH